MAAHRAVPERGGARDIWYWLAVLGGLGLLAEWLLFAPLRRPARATEATVEPLPGEPLRRAS